MNNPRFSYARDLVGYGRSPPHPHWPREARIAVQFVMNYEEGSEYSIPDGDGFSETGLSEAQSAIPQGSRDLAVESAYEYLKDTFDVLYREGRSMPRMMSVGLHMRLSGRPGRAVDALATIYGDDVLVPSAMGRLFAF